MSIKIALYGAGQSAKEFLMVLTQFSEFKVVGILDRDSNKWGTVIEGVTVYNVQKVIELEVDYIVITIKNPKVVTEVVESLATMDSCLSAKIIAEVWLRPLQKHLKNDRKMVLIKELIRCHLHSQYVDEGICVGDFTIGIPKIVGAKECARITIGKFCSMSPDVTIFRGGEHRIEYGTSYAISDFFEDYPDIPYHLRSKGDVIIGNDVWLAAGVKILSGVTIGDGAVVGAGALVTKAVPPYAIVTGIPARITGYRYADDIIKKMQQMRWWDWSYEAIYEAIPLLQSTEYDKLYDFYCEKQHC